MTPSHWKGAGGCCLVVAALLVIAAVLAVFAPFARPIAQLYVVPANPIDSDYSDLVGAVAAVLRGVVLAAFAGVAFFVGLSCFAWSGLVEARRQRAEISAELAILRRLAERDNPPVGTGPPPSTTGGHPQSPAAPAAGGVVPWSDEQTRSGEQARPGEQARSGEPAQSSEPLRSGEQTE